MSDFKMDLREFRAAFQFAEKHSKKSGPELLNRAALHAIIGGKGVRGAMQLTPRAKRVDILAIPDRALAKMIIARAKARGDKLTREEVNRRIKAERKRRTASSGYTAGPGWNQAAVAFGGRGVRLQKGFPKSRAAKGAGRRATPSRLVAEMENTAPAADKIGRKALQQGLNNQAADMVRYWEKKTGEVFKKVSA